jgi:hypothetical protein
MILKQKSKITGDFQFLENPKKTRKLLILNRKEGFPIKYFRKRPQVIDFKGKNKNLGVYP